MSKSFYSGIVFFSWRCAILQMFQMILYFGEGDSCLCFLVATIWEWSLFSFGIADAMWKSGWLHITTHLYNEKSTCTDAGVFSGEWMYVFQPLRMVGQRYRPWCWIGTFRCSAYFFWKRNRIGCFSYDRVPHGVLPVPVSSGGIRRLVECRRYMLFWEWC